MKLKIRFAWPQGKHPKATLVLLAALMAFGLVILTGFSVFGYFYFKYQGVVDERLKQPIFANTAKIFAAPREVRPAQKLTVALIANELREAGYTGDGASQPSPLGTYSQEPHSITVHPGPQSYHAQDGATIRVESGVVDSITDDHGQALASYELEPLLITGLSDDANRTKRRLITYDEIPPNLVQAVLAIEDRRFFEHSGVNYLRLIEAVYRDVTTGQKQQGGSTLTMQLARGFFLTPEKRIKRKIIEIVITFQLEHRFNKQKIFELYANEINLGQRGSFSIDGFGEAAQAYFGKDVRQLNLAESAMLAGIIQRPNYFNPFHHPERVIERRNLVLDSMVETGAIPKEQAERAKSTPLHLTNASVDASEAPYFVDLVHEQLNQKLGERDFNREGLRIYTSLDPDLQQLATTAVEETIPIVDAQIDKVHLKDKKAGKSYIHPQIALVALNPHTGQVLALVGGRSYGNSQVNHAVAHRPSGSIFKPFVYAAAFQTTAEGTMLPGQTQLFSPVTTLNDEQQTYGEGTPYEYKPRNFEGEFYGQMTARLALMRSDNNATISLASMVGFDRVAALAREAGIKSARGTPSMAIGSYDATPLDMAGAYTVFANNGLHIDPWMLASVRDPNGDIVTDYTPSTKQVLDTRVAYLTTNLLEAVLRGNGSDGCMIGGRDYCGTGAGVRNMGFTAPAAGKTGTDHDAWFAGFTSNLICVVWVGNDDYTSLDPENRGRVQGAHVAAPIWANFMKKAVQLPQYSDTRGFAPPDGVTVVAIDKASNLLSDSACPDSYNAAFLDGTAPTNTCDHPPDHRNFLQKIFGLGKPGN
ncbi:MAG TPA: PBP1A family penicillin-binding protein [Terracidiphilus sp.]|jgi:penicillin-binding protein 1B|nr:PBP1A family penicillin-binding protein [Terracidiphilus sp.]